MYLAPACSLWLLLGIAIVEWPRMAAENALGLIAAKPLLYLSAAAMGFGVNSLAYIVIQLASSLTLKVIFSCIALGLMTEATPSGPRIWDLTCTTADWCRVQQYYLRIKIQVFGVFLGVCCNC